MYFPFLRGKQYELLALREISDVLGSEHVVHPIIEPVRAPEGSGLEKCIQDLNGKAVPFNIVVNPTVGDLKSSTIPVAIENFVKSSPELASVGLALIIQETTDVDALLNEYFRAFGTENELMLIHYGIPNDLEQLMKRSASANRSFDVIQDNLRKRHFSKLLGTSEPVTLTDAFRPALRNSEFLERTESVFSEDHLYLAEENWFGFSDFTTLPKNFVEGGFSPRAVVIHWTYEDPVSGNIMIRHFTSESNEGTSNVGGKFLQALSKLVDFVDKNKINTRAARIFKQHHDDSTYPGLGVVKKLSIMNHLELVSGIISR